MLQLPRFECQIYLGRPFGRCSIIEMHAKPNVARAIVLGVELEFAV
jgi:hypothetical protein